MNRFLTVSLLFLSVFYVVGDRITTYLLLVNFALIESNPAILAIVDLAHGYTHIDRLYRRNRPTDRVDWDFWQTVDRIKRKWRRYAESFEKRS